MQNIKQHNGKTFFEVHIRISIGGKTDTQSACCMVKPFSVAHYCNLRKTLIKHYDFRVVCVLYLVL